MYGGTDLLSMCCLQGFSPRGVFSAAAQGEASLCDWTLTCYMTFICGLLLWKMSRWKGWECCTSHGVCALWCLEGWWNVERVDWCLRKVHFASLQLLKLNLLQSDTCSKKGPSCSEDFIISQVNFFHLACFKPCLTNSVQRKLKNNINNNRQISWCHTSWCSSSSWSNETVKRIKST